MDGESRRAFWGASTSDLPADRCEWIRRVDTVGPGVHALSEVGCESGMMPCQPSQRVAE